MFATIISDIPTTVPIRLYNTAKVQASLTLNRVIKQPMILSMTYTLSEPDIYFSRFYTYTVTAQRADGGRMGYIVVHPLEPHEMRNTASLENDTLTTLITGNILEAYVEQGPGIRWEVKTYDGPWAPTALIGIDTISASAAGGGGASPSRIPLSASVTLPRSGSATPGEIFSRRVHP